MKYFYYIATVLTKTIFIMRKFTYLLLLFCAVAINTFGGGYQVGLHSTRNTGMGLIGTSLTNDASSLFYNPGGAVFIDHMISITGGVSFLMARTTFQPDGMVDQYNLKHRVNYPLYLSAAVKPLKNLSVGVTVNTPYGNGLGWDDNWQGKYLIQNLSFRAFTIQPTVSFKLLNMIGIGVGLVYATGSVDLNKAIPVGGTSGDGTLNIQGNATNYGFNAGIMVQPIKNLSIGLDYRSRIKMEVKEGDATFNVPASMTSSFPNTKVDVMLPLPANLDLGASLKLGKLMVGVNFCYVFWGTYDSLVFNFQKVNDQQSVTQSVSKAMYENKLITRVGAEFQINSLLAVRAGAYYDPSPVPDNYLNPQTPSMNQTGLTAGFSLSPIKGLSVDAAFLYIMGKERKGTYEPENFAGTYKNAVYCPSLGITYNF